MTRRSHPFLLLTLLTLATSARWGRAQTGVVPETRSDTASRLDETARVRLTDTAVPPAPALLDPDEILDRLERTESELQALRESLATEDQQPGMLTALQQQFTQARDPSITTVDEQTRRPSGTSRDAKKWYDRLSIRGYAQFRYNEVLGEHGEAQYIGDRSIGENQNFLIRRARLILSGDISDHMYVYLQPDFASGIPGVSEANQYGQIRDWYGDLYIDRDKVYRVRIGQSKIPYGWENLQSSSNRIPLDRNDAIDSATRNERDLGVLFYWTPEVAQDRFKYVLDEGLKGSGNYGVFGIGLYNGQGGSLNDQNDNLHTVARLTYPFALPDGQIVEAGIQGYTGRYGVLSAPISPLGTGPAVRPRGAVETGDNSHIDQRIAGSFVWYPQPFGIQTEWNLGRGPALNAAQTEIIDRPLSGGYVMLMYRHATDRCGILFPFLRWNTFQGGYKSERNAPYVRVNEWEMGLEWQFTPQMELTVEYTLTDRTNTSAHASGLSYAQFEGSLLRSQFQINY